MRFDGCGMTHGRASVARLRFGGVRHKLALLLGIFVVTLSGLVPASAAQAGGTVHLPTLEGGTTGQQTFNGPGANRTVVGGPQPRTSRNGANSEHGSEEAMNGRAASVPPKAVRLTKRCSWSRRNHRGTRTCRYYHVKLLVKTCVKKAGHRERCTFAHAVKKGVLPSVQGAGPTVIRPPAGALATQPDAIPSSDQGEPTATGALLPTEQVEPAPEASDLTLPASVDLSTYAVPVGYQAQVGSCVTWAIDYALLGWYSRHDNRPGQPFNPMYTYFQISHGQNVGTYPKDAFKVAVEQGNDTMAHYSHQSTTDFVDQPTAADRANAANYKISEWRPLFQSTSGTGDATDAASIKATLAQGKPVVIGIKVRFPNSTVWRTGCVVHL